MEFLQWVLSPFDLYDFIFEWKFSCTFWICGKISNFDNFLTLIILWIFLLNWVVGQSDVQIKAFSIDLRRLRVKRTDSKYGFSFQTIKVSECLFSHFWRNVELILWNFISFFLEKSDLFYSFGLMDRYFFIFLKIEFKVRFRVGRNKFFGFGFDFIKSLFFLDLIDIGDGGDIAHICKHEA